MIAPTKARLTFRIRLYRTTLVVRQTPKGRNQDTFSTILYITKKAVASSLSKETRLLNKLVRRKIIALIKTILKTGVLFSPLTARRT
jgi:hypothetical protein